MNYYPRHIGDYIGATAHLSMLEDGAYTRLMDWYYLDEQPIPNDPRAIYRRCRAQSPEEREAVDVILHEYFCLDEDANAFRHSRIDEELRTYRDKSAKASAAANKRWNADASKKHANASKLDANASSGHCVRNANQEPIANSQEPITNNHEPPARATERQKSIERNRIPEFVETKTDPVPPTAKPPSSMDDGRPHRCGTISAMLRAAGISANPADPRVIAIADSGTSLEAVQAACAEAREAKPGERIALGYVAAILARWSADASRIAAAGPAEPPMARGGSANDDLARYRAQRAKERAESEQ